MLYGILLSGIGPVFEGVRVLCGWRRNRGWQLSSWMTCLFQWQKEIFQLFWGHCFTVRSLGFANAAVQVIPGLIDEHLQDRRLVGVSQTRQTLTEAIQTGIPEPVDRNQFTNESHDGPFPQRQDNLLLNVDNPLLPRTSSSRSTSSSPGQYTGEESVFQLENVKCYAKTLSPSDQAKKSIKDQRMCSHCLLNAMQGQTQHHYLT